MGRGRGTRVANAYAKISVDGDGMNDEIIDGIDEAGPGIKKKGREQGEDYGDEFGEGAGDRLEPIMEKLGDKLSQRLSRNINRNLKSMVSDSSAKGIGARLGDSIGERMSERLEERLAEFTDMIDTRIGGGAGGGGGVSGNGGGIGGMGSQDPNEPQRLYTSLDFVTKFEAARVKMHETANKAVENSDRQLVKDQQKLYDKLERDAAKRLNKDRAREKARAAFVQKFMNARTKMHEKMNADIAKDDADLVKRQQALMDRLTKENEKAERARYAFVEKFSKARIRLQEQSNAAILKSDEKLVRDQQALFNKLEREAAKRERERVRLQGKNDIGSRIGVMLGSKSRLGGLHAFGATMGGLVGLVDKVRTGAMGLFKTFAKGFSDVAEGASLFQKLLGGGSAVGSRIGAGFAGIARAAPAAAIALVTVVAAMSAMASVASALTAILVALTSTIVSALTGAVLVLGGAFVAAAAAGGLLAAAFLSMTDAQKKMLSTAFKPLKAELVGLGQLMIKDMVPAFQTWADNLKKAIGLAGPLARVMGEAFASAGNRITAALGGPGFKTLFASLRDELPQITKRLSGALGGFLNGLAGTFGAIMPLVTQFAGWLNRVAGDFSKWANSAEGQNSIKDFADRAVTSLKSLWGVIKETAGFLADLLFSKEAQESGNSMFDSLKESLEGWRKKVQEFIDSGKLEDWFKRAERFGGKLKKLIIELKDAFVKLDNSGVLDAVGDGIETLAGFIEDCNEVLGPLVDYIGVVLPKMIDAAQFALDNFTFPAVLGRLQDLYNLAKKVGDALASIRPGDHRGESLDGAEQNTAPGGDPPTIPGTGGAARVAPGSALDNAIRGRTAPGEGGGSSSQGGGKNWPQYLIDLGNAAMNEDRGGSGSGSGGSGNGGKGGGDKKKWKNPYIEWAKSLIKNGPTLSRQLSQALSRMSEQIGRSLTAAAKATDLTAARAILNNQIASLADTGKAGVQAARDALNTAAENLASATTKKEAERALKQVRRAQEDMRKALSNQRLMNKAAKMLDKQKVQSNAGALSRIGDKATIESIAALDAVQNKTLADFAATRRRAAILIESANAQLESAIQLRDSFTESVSDSAKAFGALTTAQASVIDGIEQTLSAGDITTNLQARLDKIKAFQANLRALLALGLSNEAYKQIVDAGVEGGSAYAEALIAGGGGAVGQVNGLVGQISTVADELGLEAGNRMYQAGVDAAQGLVDGLTSLSAQLDSAAAALGLSIARAVKKALGIKSPSTVMIAAMGYVGDGMVMGLDAQQSKVGLAAGRLSGQIAVSPEVAQYAARQGTAAVSGNPVNDIDITVVTPTENPHAVAMEVLNEVTGRLV